MKEHEPPSRQRRQEFGVEGPGAESQRFGVALDVSFTPQTAVLAPWRFVPPKLVLRLRPRAGVRNVPRSSHHLRGCCALALTYRNRAPPDLLRYEMCSVGVTRN